MYDAETGLYYLRSRYYNPYNYKFLIMDNNIGHAGGVLSHNSYCYCNNDPINKIDENGYE